MRTTNHITDWDDAYANRDHISEPQDYIDKWELEARAFRQSWAQGAGVVSPDLIYGERERERFDLFYPEGQPRGLFVFVHGGYWMAFDKNSWSHLAAGALAKGWAVAMPSYSLCPEVKIGDITLQIARAIEAAAGMVEGPVVLTGHSAGGHLVTRMVCRDAPLSEKVSARVRHVISISGVHDLRPLQRLTLNQTLQLDEGQAIAESPALLVPREGIAIDCVVGGAERPEFIRQNALLANVWIGLGARMREIVVPDRHHFDVIEELVAVDNDWLASALSG